MNVKELIELLKELPEDADVMHVGRDFLHDDVDVVQYIVDFKFISTSDPVPTVLIY
ncbi:hypothetical protein [Caudoviricetes sp.]|nr:hypothetical protein [Caudoviricetes sp.]